MFLMFKWKELSKKGKRLGGAGREKEMGEREVWWFWFDV